MKSHYCPKEKGIVVYENECNWCGEKEMNKPVAWLMVDRDDGSAYFKMTKPTRDEKVSHHPYPLYTHPVKELTDEEIKQIWYDLYPLSSSSYWDDKREGLAELKFAKAILRKAQEK